MKRKYKYIISERKKKYNVHFSYGIIHFWKWEKYFCISIKSIIKYLFCVYFYFLVFHGSKLHENLIFFLESTNSLKQ